MDKLKSVAKDLGRKTLKLSLWLFGIVIFFAVPISASFYWGDDVAGVVLLIQCGLAVAFAIYWKIKHPTPAEEKTSEVEPSEDRGWGWAIGFIIVLVIIGSFDDSDTSSPATNTSSNAPSNSYKYTSTATETTFYTNDTANIRSCESTTCPVIGQSDKNMPISLNYASPTEMPEWVSVGFSQGGVAKEGFMHKSVFSNTVTASPTYYGSYSGSNYHTDSRYKYNSRTGYSGDYTYDYSVEGYGDTGYAYGDVEMNGKYGEGYIYNEDGEEVYVETEWTDYGVMQAYDEYGNWYEFEVY